MLQTILESIWLFLPAGIANIMPVFAARYHWLPWLNRPLDGGATLHHCRIFGDHKTWRGLILGLIFGSIIGFIQFLLFRYQFIRDISLFSYHQALTATLLGLLLAFGALAGDAAKSFIKRQLSISPGQPWILADQVDFILGALIISIWLTPITISHFFTALIIFGLLSFLSSFFGVKLKIKKSL